MRANGAALRPEADQGRSTLQPDVGGAWPGRIRLSVELRSCSQTPADSTRVDIASPVPAHFHQAPILPAISMILGLPHRVPGHSDCQGGI
jgi:hypothetical protein